MGYLCRPVSTLVGFYLCFLPFVLSANVHSFNNNLVSSNSVIDFSKVYNGVNITDLKKTIFNTSLNFTDEVFKFLKSSDDLTPTQSVGSACIAQLWALIDEENWDLLSQMTDAWSKFPYSGLLKASRSDFGDYDQCFAIKRHTTDAGKILGKQCTYGFIIPDISQPNSSAMIEQAWRLSYCAPHLCSAYDIGNITQLPIFNDIVCSHQESREDLDAGAIVSITIFAIFGVLIILSTLYDSFVYKSDSLLANKFILTAFSIRANGKSLLSYVKKSNEQILCFHGLKFISMWWILAGHNGVSWQFYSNYDAAAAAKWQESYSAFYLMTAHLAVDTFFFISGFLLSYLYFKNSISKKSFGTQAMAVPMMVLHRYLRLTPSVLMTYLFYTFILPYIGDAPFYQYEAKTLTDPCKEYWFSIFTYIQNYYNKDNLCLTTLWYVSADMQLFLVSPLIIIPVALLNSRSYKTAMAALFSVNVIFVVLPILTKLVWRDYDPNFDEFDAHARLTDYFIGVMMGLFIRQNKETPFKLSKNLNSLLWILTIAVMFACTFVTQVINIECGYVAKALTYSITRPAWCLGLCWITYSSFKGHGGLIHKLLSNRIMQLGGKLTFCIYLVHGPLISYFTLNVRTRRMFTDLHMFYDWAGHMVLSLVFATIWALSFEFPMVTVEKYIFGGKKKTEKPKPKEASAIQ
ncbi:nose resistant to fluoxetine protein 6-like [Anthonomus grandis grandis]|uniref:nose resistant to fluoxetine protein 6-like n=1 Tax=Anthonomus grandis grandis TaxID=2921223 RepID=UPI002165121A|nr:nose resistant to fluoxetine protein 6-like [Anthonomus grandis grandis]